MTENGASESRAFAPTVGVRVGVSRRERRTGSKLQGRITFRTLYVKSVKRENAPSATTSRLRSVEKTRNRRRVRIYFTRFGVFGKRRKAKFSAKFSKTFARRSSTSSDVKKRRPESLRTSAFVSSLNRRFRRACVRRSLARRRFARSPYYSSAGTTTCG